MLGLMVICGSVAALIGAAFWMEKRGFTPRNPKAVLALVMVFMFFMLIFSVTSVFAAEVSGEAAVNDSSGMRMMAAALSTGLACLGAGLGVAFAGSAALGVLGEKPELFAKTLLYVVMGEGIAIYGMIISILILFVA